MRASTSEKPLELTRLVKQCSDILKLCHLDSERVLIEMEFDDLMKDKITREGCKHKLLEIIFSACCICVLDAASFEECPPTA